MNGNKQNRLQKLSDAIGREVCIDPIESFGLHMDSAGDLTVKGCCRISVCENGRIVLYAGRGPIDIQGTDLRLTVFSPQETQVGGNIEKICFTCGESSDAK